MSDARADLAAPHRTVEHLSAARLMPRTVLCCGALAAVVLEAALAASGAADAAGRRVHAGGVAGAADTAAEVLPADLTSSACELMLQALQAGCCVSLVMMEEEEDGAASDADTPDG
eukprot:144242-Chlamydomonas_euryale.AAC.1